MTSKGEKTRQHFIQTSAQLFNRKGYAGTAISDILEASGYSKGALYRTFESKDTLSVEAFKYNLEQVKVAIEQYYSQAKTPMEKLLAIPRFYQSRRIMEIMPAGCPLLNTALEVDDTHPEMNKLVRKGFSYFQAKIKEALELGQAEGVFRADLDRDLIATFIVASVEGGIALGKTYNSRAYLKKTMIALEAYLLTVVK